METRVSELVYALAKKLMPEYPDMLVAQEHAWQIIEYLTSESKTSLIAKNRVRIDNDKLDVIVNELVHQHKPLQYILGSIEFLDLTLTVRPPMLIPRVETEWWCEQLVNEMAPFVAMATPEKPFSVLDMCTGSGCIALAIAHRFRKNHINVVAVDNNPQALELARSNAELNNISSVTFTLSDVYSALPSTHAFDLIVANPPYISLTDYNELDQSVRNWEDKHALVAEDNGYALLERIVKGAASYLRMDYECGRLWCEIGYDQAKTMLRVFNDAGFRDVMVMKDQYNNDRVVRGTL